MKRIAAVFALFLLVLTTNADARTFGAGLTLDKTTPVSTILDNPDSYLGQKVQVKGLIVDVCAKRGCWMYIAGDKPFQKIRFKVTDGDMVFPMTARGLEATVEGILQKFVLTKEEVIDRKKHHAEETGEPFDPTSVTSGETFYQLRGLGADIPNIQ